MQQPRLETLYDMHVDLEPPQVIGQTPQGMRQVFIVRGGTFQGPRLKGEVLPGGGDWALIRPDGALQLDVRATLRTHDGALIYASYGGLIVASQEVYARIFRGEDVPLSEYYFYTNPVFQTGAPQYDWLNRTLAIGRGKVAPGAVEYRVWAIV
ncbi:MAG: DUF3237 domain-containing protein [Dehalococcoidia bacterium]|nr:DUF3237 domain-containing protein [Dehalococcoidia bacterium]